MTSSGRASIRINAEPRRVAVEEEDQAFVAALVITNSLLAGGVARFEATLLVLSPYERQKKRVVRRQVSPLST